MRIKSMKGFAGRAIQTAVALVVACSCLFGGVLANAADDELNTLTINYAHDGAAFTLYKVGEYTGYNTFYLSGAFEKYAETIDLNNFSAEDWDNDAVTLQQYVDADNPTPTATAQVSGGKAVFDGLERGLYLVGRSTFSAGGKIYTSAPFIVCLPNYDAQGNLIHALEANPKNVTEQDDPNYNEPDLMDLHLVVDWRKDESVIETVRPKNVDYTLYKDGAPYETVTLGPQGEIATVAAIPRVNPEWKHDWNSLPADSTWTISQAEIPEGYTTEISYSDVDRTFVVINTYQPKVEKKVEVRWEGDEGVAGTKRPGSLQFDLLCDGEVYGTVYLGPDSGDVEGAESSVDWDFVWDSLEEGHDWELVPADAPDGYTGDLQIEGDTFIVTYTYNPPEEPSKPRKPGGGKGDGYEIGRGDPTPDSGDPTGEHYPDMPYEPTHPGESQPYEPGESVLPGAPETPEAVLPPDETATGEAVGMPGESESLPQTGQLWWPMPILAGAGMILFLIGYIRSKGTEKNDEE